MKKIIEFHQYLEADTLKVACSVYGELQEIYTIFEPGKPGVFAVSSNRGIDTVNAGVWFSTIEGALKYARNSFKNNCTI